MLVEPVARKLQQPPSIARACELIAQHAHQRTPLCFRQPVKSERLAGNFLVLEERAPTVIHRAQRCQVGGGHAELLAQMPPQGWRHDAHRLEQPPRHAYKTDLQCQCKLERAAASLLDYPPFGAGEAEERLDLKAAQFARQTPPPQTRRLPVVHVLILPRIGLTQPNRNAEQQLIDAARKTRIGR
jgi:hypothetical protein